MLACVYVFCGSVVLGLLLTLVIRNLANTRGWVAAPASSRHIHNSAVPRLGGVAIFLSVYGVVGGTIAAANLFHFTGPISAPSVAYLGVAGAMIFAVGLWDDIYSVRPHVKLLVQAAAGTVLYFGGMRIAQLGIWQQHNLSWLMGLAATIVWVVWITNAFNLIDGVDGLAAGSALLSTVVVFLIFIIGQNTAMALLTAVLAGSIVGFLRFNFNPATIFLGDCGSLFIGFMLAASSMSSRQKSPTLVAIAIPIVAFGLPLVETALSVCRRFLSGQPLFSPDRNHIHHRLLRRGFSQRKAVIVLYAVSAFCGLMSLLLISPQGREPGIVLLVFGVAVIIFVQRLGYVEFSELQRVARRAWEQKQIIVNNLAIRRAIDELHRCNDFEKICGVLISAFSDNEFDIIECSYIPPHSIDMDMIAPFLDQNGQLRWSWQKAEGSAMDERHLEWHLGIDLIASHGESRGVFTVRRCTTAGKPLILDVNLLSSGFEVALTDALDRAASKVRKAVKSEEEIKTAKMMALFAAAGAGCTRQ